MSQRGWSELVEKQVVKLTARESYGAAVELYEELVGLELEKKTAWTRSQQRGQRLGQARQAAAKAAAALPKRQEIMPGQPLTGRPMGVAIDGVLVYILGEGWKEVKVGCVFNLERQPGQCPRTKEPIDQVKASDQSYVAYLGEPEPLAQLISAEAERRGYDQASQRVCLGDGARWIWNISGVYFPTSQEIVDWYHATTHLWTAGQLGLEGQADRLARWVKRREDDLWHGHVDRVVGEIDALAQTKPSHATELRTEAGYFQTNQRRMQYQEFREEGYPVGSGVVESGCNQIVTVRMKGPGMRWSRSGAANMLALRTEYLSDRWDEAWLLTRAA